MPLLYKKYYNNTINLIIIYFTIKISGKDWGNDQVNGVEVIELNLSEILTGSTETTECAKGKEKVSWKELHCLQSISM